MSMLSKMRIGTRLILFTSLLVVAVFAATVYVTITRVNVLSRNDADALAGATARYFAGSVGSIVDSALSHAESLASVFESAATTGDVKLDRAGANALLKHFIERNTGFLAAYVAFEPDAFDGNDAKFSGAAGHDQTGRFIPYWTRDESGRGIVEPLTDYDKKGPGDYYLLPKEQKKECVIDPYVYKVQGKDVLMTSLVVPLFDTHGAFVGIAGIDLKLDTIQGIIATAKIGSFKEAYAHVYSANGVVVASVDEKRIGKKVEDTTSDQQFILDVHAGKSTSTVRDSALFNKPVLSVTAPITFGKSGTLWLVNANIALDELTAGGRQLAVLMIEIASGAILIILLTILLISRSITKPLVKGVAFAQLVASGDFTQQLSAGRSDEVGMLADALNSMSVKLSGIVGTIKDSAEQVASSSEQITASAQKLAEGAQSQASTLEETSASVEELTASVDQVAEHAQSQAAAVEQGSRSMSQVHRSIEDISRNLAEIAELAGRSVENAQEGGRAVSEVVTGIGVIAGSSEKIGGIVNVISDIADQTNLLALNAAIEAARAGEHGRGFAVVADEVSKLADRSSTSTKEIDGLIKESVRNVTRGVETAKGSQAAMEQIRAASQKVKEMIAGLSESLAQQVASVKELTSALGSVSEMSQSISAATEEQTTNARQVSKAVENVNDVTQSAASAAEEMSASTEQLSIMAQDLQKMTGQFKITASHGNGDGHAAASVSAVALTTDAITGEHGLDVQQIDRAIGVHGSWKVHLREAIHSGKSHIDLEKARLDDACEFGKWLHTLSAAVAGTTTGRKVQSLHADFHKAAAHVLELALAANREEAEGAMRKGSEFAEVSSHMVQALMEWKDSLAHGKE
jgi:methyl-accepting chemotaxis protein